MFAARAAHAAYFTAASTDSTQHVAAPIRSGAAPASRSLAICALAVLAASMAACATPTALPQAWPLGSPALQVIAEGWHTEIAVPTANLVGPIAGLKADFPGAHYLVFGWGARGYYMARRPGLGDVLRAALPGPAVMLVVPLQARPAAAFGVANTIPLSARRGGLQRPARDPGDSRESAPMAPLARRAARPS